MICSSLKIQIITDHWSVPVSKNYPTLVIVCALGSAPYNRRGRSFKGAVWVLTYYLLSTLLAGLGRW
jgi:hypothetical protein